MHKASSIVFQIYYKHKHIKSFLHNISWHVYFEKINTWIIEQWTRDTKKIPAPRCLTDSQIPS